MTLTEKVCQMIFPALRNYNDEKVTSLHHDLVLLIAKYNFGGICLFGENSSGTKQMASLVNEINAATNLSDKKIPMVISIDQEGGYITRLSTGTSTIGNMALCATNNPENAKTEAQIISEELFALGINTNFGPVVDVNCNRNNPVIGVRSFSDKTANVVEYGKAYIDGLHENGIASCLKHFPGHGDTATDSHVGLPFVDKSLSELKETELVPFRELAESTDMIMTAHIQYPQIETSTYVSKSTGENVYLPATLSKKIITDILRNDIGFDGVVLTDALNMGAIADNFDEIDAAKLAINADVDVLLMPVLIESADDIDKMDAYIEKIVSLVESGEIDVSEIDNSVKRILTLKKNRGMFNERTIDVEHAKSVVGSKTHHETEWDLAIEAITEYGGSENPVKLSENEKVLVFVPWNSQVNSVKYAEQRLREEKLIGDQVTIEVVSYDGIENLNARDYESLIDDASIVIAAHKLSSGIDGLDVTKTDSTAKFVNDVLSIANEKDKKTIFISTQLPYDVTVFSADRSLMCYNPQGMSEIPSNYDGEVKKYSANLSAAFYIALSGKEATGYCPVNLNKPSIRRSGNN